MTVNQIRNKSCDNIAYHNMVPYEKEILKLNKIIFNLCRALDEVQSYAECGMIESYPNLSDRIDNILEEVEF